MSERVFSHSAVRHNFKMTDKIERLKKLDTDKLIDVVKNYRQYGYEENLRNSAISLLEERGITKEQLELTGNFVNRTYDFAGELYKSFSQNSKIAFILYGIVVLSNILFPLLLTNSETLGLVAVIFKIVAYILYFVFLIKSFLNQSQFYKAVGQDYGREGGLLYLFLGMPFYIFMFYYFRNQMKEKMTEIK